MQLRQLGSTGVNVSVLAFGAGPVPATMTSDDPAKQVLVVARAIEDGINWFDTAAGYGQGKSEAALGRALRELRTGDRVHVATKVRIAEGELSDIGGAVRRSVEQSLSRLGLSRVTLLQLHNSVTSRRGDEPTSLTPGDVVRSGGVLDAMEKLKAEGVVAHSGLTGIGQAAALKEVIRSGRVATMQVPYNLLNPSAGRAMPAGFDGTDYGNVIADCADMKMGVFAIRVLAGGALADQAPSGHTLKTPFFPLALYERDRERAAEMARTLPTGMTMPEAAVRFALSHPTIASAIVGFSQPGQVDEAVAWAQRGKLADDVMTTLGGKPCHPDRA